MKIGIMSDSHGHISRTVAVAEYMIRSGTRAIIHCGDIGTENVLLELAVVIDRAHIPVYAVPGNVDLYNASVLGFPPESGIQMMGRIGELVLGGHSIAVVHGDDVLAFRRAVSGGKYEFIFTGHTHARDELRTAGTHIINPGALNNTHQPSAAIVDIDTGEVSFFDVKG
ncbi:MAG: metallophosphatase family protein [Verrucomicrobia bacterium]|nr:metallophosphatase family protein [Verrucomicrobiota bacterium]